MREEQIEIYFEPVQRVARLEVSGVILIFLPLFSSLCLTFQRIQQIQTMPRLTRELIRRKAEHHEGILPDLEEISLHQLEIERIEVVGDICRKIVRSISFSFLVFFQVFIRKKNNNIITIHRMIILLNILY
jgi:hypothetical protein